MQKLAILYQASLPPLIDGIRKPMKAGGYSDSGADIACALQEKNWPLVTPAESPRREEDFDWVFPDTRAGIQEAYDRGARIFWLNTVLYAEHPMVAFADLEVELIGQIPGQVEIYDDKWHTNHLLEAHGLPIPHSVLLSESNWRERVGELAFPVVLKPLRGRGSQGVSLAKDRAALEKQLAAFFAAQIYGSAVYLESFLSAQEITISVMPPGHYTFGTKQEEKKQHWSLPVVKRFNHQNGIAPYSGKVAVMENSAVLSDAELAAEPIRRVSRQCELAAELIAARAPIRIDARADAAGNYFLFDLNLKPNMTGPSRPHRRGQDSLTALAARKLGWTYADLVTNIIAQKWPAKLLV